MVDTPTFNNRNNVLGVMMDACRKKSDDEHWLQYAIERAELSRSHSMETEALRMEALHLIRKEPDTPVSAIAEAVGFTPANFREQFKREFGMTPTEYRQNV